MRTIKTLLLVAAITFSSVLSASTEPTKDETTVITEEIGNLLKSPKFQIDHNMFATVKILFNKDNEMVVLSVDSENEVVSSYIKRRLNYKSLSVNMNNTNKSFIVPVKITPRDG